jgi:hypothetical protein
VAAPAEAVLEEIGNQKKKARVQRASLVIKTRNLCDPDHRAKLLHRIRALVQRSLLVSRQLDLDDLL